jgi:hypothetical protein
LHPHRALQTGRRTTAADIIQTYVTNPLMPSACRAALKR